MSRFTLIEDKTRASEHHVRNMEILSPFSPEEMAKLGIVNPAMDDGDIVNAFRQLRTSLRAKMAKFNTTVLVTSVTKGGGASFTALNLASAFTFDHSKSALLIDCNFRNPSLAERLQLEYEYGLKDYIAGSVDDIADIVCHTRVPRLRLVPCGRADTDVVEFFTTDKMHFFLEEVKGRYPDRVIIIDSPPVTDSADTKILAELCNYVLLVLPYKGVTPGAVGKTLNSIDRNKIAGMILNK